MNVAIVTARAGSKSIINKNVMSLGGRPMVQYPIQAALDAARIQEVWVSTDGEAIADASRAVGAKIIPRPDELGGDSINHGIVIKHAVEYVDARVEDLENVVLLLGNTVMIDGPTIDRALEVLDQRRDIDSVMTVWEAADDHPYRALEIQPDGLVTTFGGARKVFDRAPVLSPRLLLRPGRVGVPQADRPGRGRAEPMVVDGKARLPDHPPVGDRPRHPRPHRRQLRPVVG